MARKNTRPDGRHTIRDVAARAGVSPSTVSRVLGGEYPVSEDTRSRVMRAVSALDYVADARAKAVAGAGTPTLAFVLDDITGPSFALMAQGVEREAKRLGHLCLVCSTDGDDAQQLAFVDMMRAQRAAAVILVGGAGDTPSHHARMAKMAHALQGAGSRLVLCGRPPLEGQDAPPVTVIEYDNESGAHALTTHLLAKGHRRILLLGGAPDNATQRGRERGYLAAHEAYGVTPDPALRLQGDFTRDSGYGLMRRALEGDGRPGFTAVFAATDMVASGALTALREAGLSVPDDVSLVGYDDIPLARDLHPTLTTVHVPYQELGRLAVDTAINRSPDAPDEHLLVGTHVVVRNSVAAPRSGGRG
ncbi:LacI family DNA-binding transcriptional regulator [Streptomyces boninensis]|uniref:LacI family DNA-binding transcriptional regulator n=1 Tax=Streptomyces boninensis TaxID=2039455 RepID=UPI003B214BBE